MTLHDVVWSFAPKLESPRALILTDTKYLNQVPAKNLRNLEIDTRHSHEICFWVESETNMKGALS